MLFRSKRSRVGLLAVASMMLVAMIAPAQGQALFRFGSKLDDTVQPSNASTPHECDANPGGVCTWVMNEAYGRPDGGEKSPGRGILKKLRLIANDPGSFRLFIARAFDAGSNKFEGKVVRKGPVIHYQGQPDPDEPYVVEVFRLGGLHIKIRKGDRLAVKTNDLTAMRCSSGGNNTLLYSPPLPLGGPFVQQSNHHEGCWMLLEAVVRKPIRH